MKPLSVREAQAYEALVDAYVRAQPLPSANRPLSVWHLFTVAEDMIRVLWREISPSVSTNDDLMRALGYVLVQLNSFKYGLRYSLQSIQEQQPPDSFLKRPRLRWESYHAAGELLQVLTGYEMAVRAFASFYNNTATCLLDNEKGELVFHLAKRELAANALDFLMPQCSEEPSGVGFLLLWLAGLTEMPSVAKEIVSQVISRGLRIDYSYNRVIARNLMDQLPDLPAIVPDEWSFPWATTSQIRILQKALGTRAIYHFLAVDGGASFLLERGQEASALGVENLCLVTSTNKLASELSALSGLGVVQVSEFVEYLTYGTMTRTPDPALQPLIPVGSGGLLLPPLMIASSNMERNLLSLYARTHTKSFDSQSHLFERQMMNEVSAVVSQRFSNFRLSTTLPSSKDAGEIDLIVADPPSRTALVGELRWMLPPGDAREVYNRKSALRDKVSQLRRKLDAARMHFDELLGLVGVDIGQTSPLDWEIVGLIIVDGYYGEPVEETGDLVVVPQEVFFLATKECGSLRSAYVWLSSMRWMPGEGSHYIHETALFPFGEQAVRWEVLKIQCTPLDYLSHLKSSCTEVNRRLIRVPTAEDRFGSY